MPKCAEFAQKVTKNAKGLSSRLDDDLGDPDRLGLDRLSSCRAPLER
jgi:hypothetical protein